MNAAMTRRDVIRRLGLGAAAAAALPEALAASSVGRAENPAVSRPAIRLDANANAYGASPHAVAALQDAAARVGRIGEVGPLRDAIAAHHRVSPDHVLVGCGAGEILRMAARAFTGPTAALVTGLPTYSVIAQYAERGGARVDGVRLAADWSHDLGAMFARCHAGGGLVYICNPNNPTGSLTPRPDLERFLSRLPASVHVVIDEAYHDYVDPSSEYRSLVDHAVTDPRVVVVRTFSKIHGLAGMRVGYAIAASPTCAALASHALEDAVSGLAVRAALAALDDESHAQRSRTRNINDRQEFLNQANARMLRCIDSQTNFVMMGTEHPVGTSVERVSALTVVEHFARHRIVLPQPFAPLEDYVRVSLGTADAMREFWRVWDLAPHHM